MPSCTHGPSSRVLLAAIVAGAGLLLLCAWVAPVRAQVPPPEYAPGCVIVKYKPSVQAATRASMRAALGAEVVSRLELIDAELLDVRGVSVPEAVTRLRLDPRVEYAEPDYLVHALRAPNDPRYPEQYGLHNLGQTGGVAGADIGAEAAWDRFTGDPSIIVGVIDTGMDLTHPDLAPNLWTNPGEIPANGVDDDGNGYVDDIHGYDFVNRDGDPTDDNGHGTHCCGVIAARGDDGVGIAGVNWRLQLMALKFLDYAGSGTSSNAVLALQYAVRMGCRLTSNSWGGGPASQAMLNAVAAAGAAGQLFVTAAGNAGSDNDAVPVFPASYSAENILVVAATDHADQLTGFSNYGLTSVDIAAPGDQILSTWPGGGYRLLSGTSMATPHVAGAAAFLLGRFPSMTAMQAKAQLMRLSRSLPGLATRMVSGGRLDLALASADPDTIAPGALADLRVERVGSNRVALAWTATGDDSSAGRASLVEVRYRVGGFDPDSFATASLAGQPSPPGAGETQHFEITGLAADSPYAFALRARDEFGNPGPISAVLSQRTLPPPRVRVNPLAFSAALNTGDSLSREVELFNDSPGTYDWQAPQPALDRVAPQPAPAWPEPTGSKGVDAPARSAQPAGEGGPDAFGYRWLDSRTSGGPVFRWVDVIAPANQLSITGDEQMSDLMPVGFTFPFYGRQYTRVRVGTNGYLSFGNNGPAFLNGGLPTISGPRALVAPLWDDLDFGAGEKRAYAHFDGARFVVTWVDVARFNDPGSRLTFQAILYPSGEIRFQYLRLAGQLESATVGIQDSSRTTGLTVAYDQPFLGDSLAVRIAPERQWLSMAPTRGELGPGERATVRLRFDAKGLGSGRYHGIAHLLGNDPLSPDIALDATLSVTGAPDLLLLPRAISFGAVFSGGLDTLQLVLSNTGADPLVITAVDMDVPQFQALVDREPLLPGESRPLSVVFHAEQGGFTGVLTLHSNDPDEPAASVAITGVGAPAPVLVLESAELRAALTPELVGFADSTTRMVLLRNQGGSQLVWSAAAFQGGAGTAATRVGCTEAPGTKGEEPSRTAALAPSAPVHRGGPDAAGYRWIDSDEPGGPAFQWLEISGIGTRVFGSADDSTATAIALPFVFPFHGRPQRSVNICTNGWLSFTSSLKAFRNVTLPDSGASVPRDLIAPWWDDLDLRSAVGAGRVYHYYDGTRFIVEWTDCVHYGFGGPYTFQVLLWPDGTIDFQYLRMTPRTDGATIGLQDARGAVGLTVVSDAAYVHDGLRVRVQRLDDWLVLGRTAGVVPPGGVDSLRVGLRARGRTPGTYAGELRLLTNDPRQLARSVPAAIDVRLTRAAASATPHTLGPLASTPSVRVEFALPSPQAPLVAGSLRVNGRPHPAALTPGANGVVTVSLESLSLLDRFAPGDSVLTLAGEQVGAGWFVAQAKLRLSRPDFAVGPLPAQAGGAPPWRALALEPLRLYWSAPTSEPEPEYAVSLSRDDARSWELLGVAAGNGFVWIPAEPIPGARLEVTARAAGQVVGTWLSAPFEIWPPNAAVGPAIPLELALRARGSQPAHGAVSLDLALPERSPVRVELFDLRGARVVVLARGVFEAGVHALDWQLAPHHRGAGNVYFVRAQVGSRTLTRRLVVLP